MPRSRRVMQRKRLEDSPRLQNLLRCNRFHPFDFLRRWKNSLGVVVVRGVLCNLLEEERRKDLLLGFRNSRNRYCLFAFHSKVAIHAY